MAKQWCFWRPGPDDTFVAECGHESVGDLTDDVSDFQYCPWCGVHMVVLDDPAIAAAEQEGA